MLTRLTCILACLLALGHASAAGRRADEDEDPGATKALTMKCTVSAAKETARMPACDGGTTDKEFFLKVTVSIPDFNDPTVPPAAPMDDAGRKLDIADKFKLDFSKERIAWMASSSDSSCSTRASTLQPGVIAAMHKFVAAGGVLVGDLATNCVEQATGTFKMPNLPSPDGQALDFSTSTQFSLQGPSVVVDIITGDTCHTACPGDLVAAALREGSQKCINTNECQRNPCTNAMVTLTKCDGTDADPVAIKGECIHLDPNNKATQGMAYKCVFGEVFGSVCHVKAAAGKRALAEVDATGAVRSGSLKGVAHEAPASRVIELATNSNACIGSLANSYDHAKNTLTCRAASGRKLDEDVGDLNPSGSDACPAGYHPASCVCDHRPRKAFTLAAFGLTGMSDTMVYDYTSYRLALTCSNDVKQYPSFFTAPSDYCTVGFGETKPCIVAGRTADSLQCGFDRSCSVTVNGLPDDMSPPVDAASAALDYKGRSNKIGSNMYKDIDDDANSGAVAVGCFKDQVGKRDLAMFRGTDGKLKPVDPNELSEYAYASVAQCINLCTAADYRFAGVQNGGQTYDN
ncbi:hypothetical protein JKP88DRAFT_286880 [Tribonema minus]|uniref:Uncharacterized protein n=1 Tax=Tribonema minus TaxID=303371 RepID=A0A836CL32_9STRA|nr:hypothetical protein JKP88DRAFT_286880 [Tribonema minus]